MRAEMMHKFQMFALPDSMKSAGRSPYDESCSDSDDDSEKEDEKADKQDIIRRVLVDAYLEHTLKSATSEKASLVAVMTDLEFFGPSVAREAVFASLRFLGVQR